MKAQGREEWKQEFSLKVAAGSFLAFCAVLLLALLVNGCAAYPRTPAPIPPELIIQPIGYIDRLPPQEGDDKLVQVTVGGIRQSLATAEAYSEAVASQNRAAKGAALLAEIADDNALRVAAAVEAGHVNTLNGVLLGFVGGLALGTITLLIVR